MACNTLGAGDKVAKAANLARLKWRGWGSPNASATGIDKGFGRPYAKTKVEVTLSRPKLNDCGGYSYTQLRVKSKEGTRKQAIPAVCSENG